MTFLIFLSVLVFAQGLNQEEVTIKEHYENEDAEVFVPLMKEYIELNTLIEEVKQYQQTQKISSLAFAERVASLPSQCLPTDGLNEKEVISRKPSEKNSEDFLGQLLKKYAELSTLIEEVKQHQETQKISSLAFAERIASLPPQCLPTGTPLTLAWNSDACGGLAQTLEKATDLAKTVIGWGCKAGLNIGEKFFDVLHCTNINPFTVIKCIINYINDLNETVKEYKPDVLEINEDIAAQIKELKEEFDQCFGLQKQAEAFAENIVVQAQLCVNTKL